MQYGDTSGGQRTKVLPEVPSKLRVHVPVVPEVPSYESTSEVLSRVLSYFRTKQARYRSTEVLPEVQPILAVAKIYCYLLLAVN